MVDRINFLSNSEFHQNNLEFIVQILIENDYPLEFIFKIIKRNLVRN